MTDDIYTLEVEVDDTQVKKLQAEVAQLQKQIDVLTKNPQKAVSLGINVKSLQQDLTNTQEQLNDLVGSAKRFGTAVSQNITKDRTILPQSKVNAAQLAQIAADKRQLEAEKQHQIEIKGIQRETVTLLDTKKALNDAIDEGVQLTKKEREQGLRVKALSDKPGAIPDVTEKQLEDFQKRQTQRFVIDPGFSKRGEWIKQAVQHYSETALPALNTMEKVMVREGRIIAEGVARYSKAKSTSGIQNADYAYGRSAEDKGIVYDELTKSAYETKIQHKMEEGTASRTPQGRSLDDRMYLFTNELATRFRGASKAVWIMYQTGDKYLEDQFRAVTDQYFGTNTQTPDEKAIAEEYFNPLTTIPDTGYENLGLNPSLTGRAAGQVGKSKRQDYSRAHPIHALHMVKKMIADMGQNAELLMPKEAIDQAYKEITEVTPYKASDIRIDKKTTFADQLVARHKEAFGGEGAKDQLEQFINEYVKLAEQQRKSFSRALTSDLADRSTAIWEGLKRVKRIEGRTTWVNKYIKLMASYSNKDWKELINRPSNLQGPERMEGYMQGPYGNEQNQARLRSMGMGPKVEASKNRMQQLFEKYDAMGHQVDKRLSENEIRAAAKPSNANLLTPEEIKAAIPQSKAKEGVVKAKSDNTTGLISAAMVQRTVNQITAYNEAAAEFVQNEVIDVPNDVMNRALGGLPRQVGSSIQAPMTEVITHVQDRLGDSVQKIHDENMALINSWKPQVQAGRVEAAEIQKSGMAQMGNLRPEVQNAATNPGVGPSQLMYMRHPWQQLPSEMLKTSAPFTNMPEGKMQVLLTQIANTLPPTTTLQKFISTITSMGMRTNVTPNLLISEANAATQRHIARYGPPEEEGGTPGGGISSRSKMGQFMGQEPFNIMPMGRMQRMLGVNYKVKLSFTDMGDFTKAQEILQQMPGYIKMSTKEYEHQEGVEEDVLHTLEMTGKVRSEEEVEKLRYGAKFAGSGKSVVPETASLEIDNRRTTAAEKMLEVSNRLDKLNWKLVRGQMAMLGMYFSMMSVTNMVSRAWQTLGTSISKLETVFQNIGEVMAFGPKNGAMSGLVKTMLGDTKNIVGAWKEYKYLTASINVMLAYVAYKIFSDKRIMMAILDLVNALATKLSDPGFINRIIDLVANLLNAIPTIVDFMMLLVSVLTWIAANPTFAAIVAGLVAFGIAASVAMPILAAFGAIVEGIVWFLGGLAWALGVSGDIAKAWESFKAMFKSGWLATAFSTLGQTLSAGLAELAAIGTGTGTLSGTALAASIGVGLLLGMAGVWLLVQSGFTKGLAEFGKYLSEKVPFIMNVLKVLSAPFAMLGALIIDIVTGQFDNIVADLENIAIQAIKAFCDLMVVHLLAIPIVGVKLAEGFANASVVLGTLLAATKTSTQLPQAASGGYVTQSGLAVIHKGETITPATQIGNTTITNYNTITVNNKTDEKYLQDLLSKKYYGQAS